MLFEEIERDGRKSDHVITFNSVDEWIGKTDSKEYQRRRTGFVGEYLPTWMHVKDRNLKTTKSALDRLEECRKMIKDRVELPEMKSRKRKRKLDEAEGDLDVERYISGDDNIFEKTERESTLGVSEVTIVIDICTNFTVKPEDIFWKGACGLLIAEICEEKGYATRIFGCSTVSSFCPAMRGRKMALGCPLKECQDPFDAPTMSNALAGWFFRTVNFTTWKTLARFMFDEEVYENLGFPTIMDHKMLQTFTGDDDAYYIAGIEDLPGAVEVVVATIDKIREAHERMSDPDWDSPTE